jgi:predicted metal-binding membrane protein
MVWATSALAWGTISVWSASPYSVYLGHSELGDVSSLVQLLPLTSFFLLGWTVMVLAMMLPTVFPLINEFRKRRAIQPVSASLKFLVAGSMVVWVPFGIGVYFLDLGIHRAAESPSLVGNTWVLGVSSLALAGVYQFSRRKREFLKDCCYPSDFVQGRWRSNLSDGGAFRIGLGYGGASMGSHWALMLLMFSLGLGSVPLMLIMGFAMAAEHVPRLGPRIRFPIGVVILVLASYLGISALGV